MGTKSTQDGKETVFRKLGRWAMTVLFTLTGIASWLMLADKALHVFKGALIPSFDAVLPIYGAVVVINSFCLVVLALYKLAD